MTPKKWSMKVFQRSTMKVRRGNKRKNKLTGEAEAFMLLVYIFESDVPVKNKFYIASLLQVDKGSKENRMEKEWI